MSHLMLVDGNNLHSRAVFAAKGRAEMSAHGINTASLHIGLTMLAKYVRVVEPTHLIVAFDAGYAWRTEIIPEYKADRKEKRSGLDPEEVRLWNEERDLFSLVLGDIGVPIWSVKGREADDLIAACVHAVAGSGTKVSIISGDRDLTQLIHDGDVVQYLLPEDTPTDAAAFSSKHGYPPHHMPWVKALQGDSSDNLSGVPGLGPKKSLALIERSGWDWGKVLENLKDDGERDIAARTLKVVDLTDEALLADLIEVAEGAVQSSRFDPQGYSQEGLEVLEALQMKSTLSALTEGRLWAAPPIPVGSQEGLFEGM